MKILLLNPHFNASHPLVRSLRSQGAALLLPEDAEEAWQVLHLHGKSVDLGIIHRESSTTETGTLGEELITRIKKDSLQGDLPLIMTTERWADAECATHQSGPDGVNAYLHFPFSEQALLSLIQDIFGKPLQSQSGGISLRPGPTTTPATPSLTPNPKVEPKKKVEVQHQDFGETVLEDSSTIFRVLRETSSPSIKFEIPELEEGLELSAPPSSASPDETVSTPAQMNVVLDESGGWSESQIEVEPISENDSSSYVEVPFRMESLSFESPLGHEPEVQGSVPESVSESASESESEADAEKEMPYLYSTPATSNSERNVEIPHSFSPSLGDAVVPGGAATSPDLETVKKYLLLREQDVAVLSSQLKAAKSHSQMLEKQLREERAAHADTLHLADSQKRRIEDFEREKLVSEEALQAQVLDLNFQIKTKSDKARLLESQLRDSKEELERFKERVRTDIRKIRVREKELENRLEILKKDSESLISSRENKLMELKRKLDLMEFNMDLLQEQYACEKEESAKLREKLEKASQIIKMAGGLLDSGKTEMHTSREKDNSESG